MKAAADAERNDAIRRGAINHRTLRTNMRARCTPSLDETARYLIRVQGRIGARWTEWFGGATVILAA